MKEKILQFVDGMILHDYLLFGGSFVLFILLLALAVILRRRVVAATILVFLSFSILFLGPTLGYMKLHEYLFSNEITIKEVKELEFTDALIIWGDINNTSNRPFESCSLTASVYKVANNPLLDTLYPLNPFRKSSIITESIAIGQSRPFKLIVEPFTYMQDYNVSVGAKCQ